MEISKKEQRVVLIFSAQRAQRWREHQMSEHKWKQAEKVWKKAVVFLRSAIKPFMA